MPTFYDTAPTKTEDSKERHEVNHIRAQFRSALQTVEETERENVAMREANALEINRNNILASM